MQSLNSSAVAVRIVDTFATPPAGTSFASPGRGRAIQDCVMDDSRRVPHERLPPRGHFIKDRAETDRSVRLSNSSPRTCSGDMKDVGRRHKFSVLPRL